MRALFINSLEPNQGDFYFLGLRELLGESNVVEYPYKPLYHCSTKNGLLVATDLKGDTVLEEEPLSGTLKYGAAVIPKICGLPGSKRYDISGFPDVEGYDIVICNFLRNTTPLYVRRILSCTGGRVPALFFIDGYDDYWVRSLYKEDLVVGYFKREVLVKLPEDLPLGLIGQAGSGRYEFVRSCRSSDLRLCKPIFIAYDGLLGKMSPLNITTRDYGFRPTYDKKVYDLSFVANATSELRMKVCYALLRIARRHKLNCFIHLGTRRSVSVPWRRYTDIVGKSKLSVSVPGAGFDTYRYWEIPYHGAGLVSWNPWIKIPDNFADGNNAIFYRDVEELEGEIVHHIRSGEWESVAKKGREHFMRYHTPERRAHRILSALETN